MLSREDNELVTRVGPGTPMGEVLRRHWLPAMLASELPEPACPPVRIRLLGEDLVAFRDADGNLGLLEEHCAHRRASLFFGHVDGPGLRCAYHGWQFDVDGRCIDMPNEPPESSFKERVRQPSYPLVERNGVLWTYMGPPPERPDLPDVEWMLVPPEHTYISKRLQECNYLQALEGGIDSSHISFLHRGDLRRGLNNRAVADTAPRFETVPTDYGLMIGARRRHDDRTVYWRVTQWMMPFYTVIPRYEDHPFGGHAWVPIDDEHCYTWSFAWHPDRPITPEEIAHWEEWTFVHAELIPGTFRPVLNKDNDYMIDRELQRSGRSYTGIRGLGMQDQAVQESMGPICDRTRERVGSADLAVIHVRRLLLGQARKMQRGEPLHRPRARSYRVRSAAVVMAADEVGWPEAVRDEVWIGHEPVAR